MQKKFEINRTKIKGGCQSGKKVTHNSKSDLTLVDSQIEKFIISVSAWFAYKHVLTTYKSRQGKVQTEKL